MDNNFNQLPNQDQSTPQNSQEFQQSAVYRQEQPNGQQPAPQYSQEYQQSAVYQQAPMNQQSNMYQSAALEEPVSVGHWLVCMLVAMIPCVGLIMMFVWAFSSEEKKSKSNFYKASLIFSLVYIVFIILFAIILSVSTLSMVGSFY